MVYNVCTVQKFLISLYYMKTDSYYTDKSRVNNSALGYFLKSPRFFHKMMTEDVEQESKTSLEFGTALYSLMNLNIRTALLTSKFLV